MGVVVDGGAQFATLAVALKRAEEQGLARVLDEGFRAPLRDLMPALAASQRRVLPKRGGAAAEVTARTRFYTRKVVKGAAPGMRLQANQRGRIGRQDKGILRHPLAQDVTSGKPRDAWEWIDQPIAAGWFSDVVKAAQPDIRRRTEQTLDDVARQVTVDMARAKRG